MHHCFIYETLKNREVILIEESTIGAYKRDFLVSSFIMSQQIARAPDQQYKPLLNIYDLLDRVLDKGLVIDANVSVSLVGIEILVIRARIVVAGIDTFLRYASALGLAAPQPIPEMKP